MRAISLVASFSLLVIGCGGGPKVDTPGSDVDGGGSGQDVRVVSDVTGAETSVSAQDGASRDGAIAPSSDAADSADSARSDSALPNEDASSASTDAARSDAAVLADAAPPVDGAPICEPAMCRTPPATRCEDDVLVSFPAEGRCSGSACAYDAQRTTCPRGCEDGACRGDPCAGVMCNAAPESVCLDSSTVRTFAAIGRCSGGSCTYTGTSQNCAFGCVDGACATDPCSGITCRTPPVNSCIDSHTRRVWSSSGTCASGSCTYSQRSETCPAGCSGGTCLADPCAGMSCSSPPADSCVSENVARRYGAGVCRDGSCAYTPTDIACPTGCTAGRCNAPVCGSGVCDSPPANTCMSARVATQHARYGRCNAGECIYQAVSVTCSEGCLNGACLPGSWTNERNPVTLSTNTDSFQSARDAQGVLHIAFREGQDVKYLRRDEYGWSLETVDRGLGSPEVTLALDAQGRPSVAYYDQLNADLRFASRDAEGTWSVSLVATTGTVGASPALIFDASGTPLIVHQRTPTATAIAKRSGDSWTFETPTPAFFEKRVARDSSGRVHLLGRNSTLGRAEHWVLTDAAWSMQQTFPAAELAIRPFLVDSTGRTKILVETSPRSELAIFDTSEPAPAAARVVSPEVFNTSSFLYGSIDQPRIMHTQSMYQIVEANDVWSRVVLPATVFNTAAVFDFPTLSGVAEERVQMLARFQTFSHIVMLIEQPACVPSCDERSCGDDGCGGTCGNCASTSYCDALGQCGPTRFETLPATLPNSSPLTIAASSENDVHLATSDFRHDSRSATGWSTEYFGRSTNQVLGGSVMHGGQFVVATTQRSTDPNAAMLLHAALPIATYTSLTPLGQLPVLVTSDTAELYAFSTTSAAPLQVTQARVTTGATDLSVTPAPSAGGAGQFVAAIRNGVTHAAWTRSYTSGATEVLYARRVGGSWSTPIQLGTEAFTAYPSIAAVSGSVAYVTCSSAATSARTTSLYKIVDGVAGEPSRLAVALRTRVVVNDAGTAFILAAVDADGSFTFYRLPLGGALSSEPFGVVDRYTSSAPFAMAMDPNGGVHTVFSDGVGPYRYAYRRPD